MNFTSRCMAMSEGIQFLMIKKDDINIWQLLASLMELVDQHKEDVEKVVSSTAMVTPNKIDRLVKTLAQGDPNDFQSPCSSGKNIPVGDLVWQTLASPVTDSLDHLVLTIVACIRHLDRKVEIFFNYTSFVQVVSPLTGAEFFMTPHARWPWNDRELRYSMAMGFLLQQVRLIPAKTEGIDRIGLHGLDSRTQKSVEDLARQQRFGEEKNTNLHLGFWPVSRHLDFPVKFEGPFTNFEGDTPYTCFRLEEGDNNWSDLCDVFCTKILPWCEERNVMVLLMPELAVPKTLLNLLQTALKTRAQEWEREGKSSHPRPLFIVAGSCHVPGNKDDPPFAISNETVVLDGRSGEIVRLIPFDAEYEGRHVPWTMRKMAPFRFNRENMPEKARPAFGLALEQVRYAQEPYPAGLGHQIPLVMTAVGIMAVAICKDYLSLLSSWQPSLLNKSWLDWLFIPSASLDTKEFMERNKAWSKKGCFVLVGNSCWLLNAFSGWSKAEIVLAAIPQRSQKRRWQWKNPGDPLFSDTKSLSLKPDLYDNVCNYDCSCCLWTLDVETDHPPGDRCNATLA